MYFHISSAHLVLCLILAFAILCATAAVAFSTVKSTQVELEHFIRPVTAGTSSSPSSSSTPTSSDKEFSARLTASKEVPPVDTDATGRIRLVAKSQDALDYQISLSNLNGVVTGAHIHRGSTGTNGPVVANLNIGGAFASASAGDGSASASTSSGGTITSSDLKGPLAGKHVSDLIKLIEDGNAYANVHTRQHPNGEIRGQLLSSSPSSSDVDNGISASSGGASATASATAP
jgi:Cu/Zn superoxide dismutase